MLEYEDPKKVRRSLIRAARLSTTLFSSQKIGVALSVVLPRFFDHAFNAFFFEGSLEIVNMNIHIENDLTYIQTCLVLGKEVLAFV